MIEQALHEGRQLRLEQAKLHSASAANLGVLMARVNGAKKPESRWFNEAEVILFHQQAVKEVDPKTAASFMRLYKKGRVPEWVIDHVDLEVMKSSASAEGSNG